MFPDLTYISLGISPNADAIVVQPITPDGIPPGFNVYAFTISIAELDSFGRADAIDTIGQFALGAMRAYYPVINIYADALIAPIRGQRLTVEPPDHTGCKRNLHLRVKAITHKEKSVVIERFNNDHAAGGDSAPLLLETLIGLGPNGATDCVGATLLDELAALHPQVFAPFSGLRAAQ